MTSHKLKDAPELVLAFIPVLIGFWVWFSSLSFVPVPWPDDSAFYFVAKDFFKWPPQWVMLPQAPFEPSYAVFNFNTMPLYPILIGLGRFVGIDGSFLLKFWPISTWALSGSLLGVVLYRRGLAWWMSLVVALSFVLDPETRWASVLVRPESLVGLVGLALVLGLTFGFPKYLAPRKYFDPIAALLALGAYAHFNAIHLIFPVVMALAFQPRRLFEIGLKTLLYLSPWILAAFFHWGIFIQQMATQWHRLDLPNPWLNSMALAISGLFLSMGSPEPFPQVIAFASLTIWAFIFTALGFLVFISTSIRKMTKPPKYWHMTASITWIIASIWLYLSKPEPWFMYFIHIAVWCFAGVFLFQISRNPKTKIVSYPLTGFLIGTALLFGYINWTQEQKLNASQSWHWPVYYDWIDCIDQRLTQLEAELDYPKPFRVWDPTFPDITIELSRRHPNWAFTRTEDFSDRYDLGVRHGWEVEAVVVPETLHWEERNISGAASNYPQIQSAWMTWRSYFLYRLWTGADWKPNRYICQRGRWQAFLFMNEAKPRGPAGNSARINE